MEPVTLTPATAETRPRLALATLCAVLFLMFLDTTIVSVALGDVQSDLHDLALGVVLVGAALRYVPESADPQPGRFDAAGAALGAAFLGCVIYAAIDGETVGYRAASSVALFTLGGLAFVAFILVESRARHPMLNFRYLRPPLVRSALIVAFAVYFGVFSIFFFTALYLQQVFG